MHADAEFGVVAVASIEIPSGFWCQLIFFAYQWRTRTRTNVSIMLNKGLKRFKSNKILKGSSGYLVKISEDVVTQIMTK